MRHAILLVFFLFDHRCLTQAAPWDKHAITIPREGTSAKAMEEEFFRTVANARVYSKP